MGYYQRSLPPLWIGVAIALYAFIAIGVAEGGLGVLLPSMVSTYNLTPATVTLLFVSQISGYILAAFTSSLVSSRLGLARMLLIAAVVLTMALIIYATSPYWLFIVQYAWDKLFSPPPATPASPAPPACLKG